MNTLSKQIHFELFRHFMVKLDGVNHLPIYRESRLNAVEILFALSPQDIIHEIARGADELTAKIGISSRDTPYSYNAMDYLIQYACAWRDEYTNAYQQHRDEIVDLNAAHWYSLSQLKKQYVDSAGAKIGSTIGEILFESSGMSSSLGNVVGKIIGGSVSENKEESVTREIYELSYWYAQKVEYLSQTCDQIFYDRLFPAMLQEFRFN